MAYASITKPSLHFNTKIYTGNSSTLNVTGVGFQPDFTWIKDRTSSGDDHALFDAVRGVTKRIRSNQNDAENTDSNSLTAFDSDGFTVGTTGAVNGNGDTFVSWNWKANGAGSANTSGTINTTSTSANTTAGFSIIKYTGTGSNGTVGHGLGVAPEMILGPKVLTTNNDFMAGHNGLDATAAWDKYIYLNDASAAADANTMWNDTYPTSTVISLGTHSYVNYSGRDYIMYAFASVKGFSKCGSYLGNGTSTFVYTGFKPRFLMIKNRSESNGWLMLESSRTTSNPMGAYIYANASSAEGTVTYVDFLSNGFALKSTSSVAVNKSGNTFVYYAVAEEPLVANVGESIPATAR